MKMEIKSLRRVLVLLACGLMVLGGCQKYRQWREQKYQETKIADKPATQPTILKDPTLRSETKDSPVASKDNQAAPPRETTARHPEGSVGAAVLVVNRDHITADEVLRRAKPQLQSTAMTYDQDVYFRRAEDILVEVIRELISETVLYQEIAARITEEQEPAVQKAVDKEVGNLATLEAGGSEVLLEKKLAEQGSNMDELKKQLRKQIVTQQYLRERMKPKVIVTRDELWEYYQANQGDFVEPASVHLLLIEIDAAKNLPEGMSWDHANSTDRQAAQAKAEATVKLVQEKLAKGVDFATVAKEHSTAVSSKIGGDMGWISKGSYRLKVLEDAAFSLNVGEVSKPICVETRTYLVKVAEFKPGRTIGFAEAQDEIKQQMEQAVYRKLVMEYLTKISQKAQIGSLGEFLDEVVARLPSYESLRKAGRQ